MLGQISMTEPLLYLTALPGMPVYDLKGRRIGPVKDAAVAPTIHPARVDRCLAGDDATVEDAIAALRGKEDLLETLNTVFLVDAGGRLVASVPWARLFVAPGGARLRELAACGPTRVAVDKKGSS